MDYGSRRRDMKPTSVGSFATDFFVGVLDAFNSLFGVPDEEDGTFGKGP